MENKVSPVRELKSMQMMPSIMLAIAIMRNFSSKLVKGSCRLCFVLLDMLGLDMLGLDGLDMIGLDMIGLDMLGLDMLGLDMLGLEGLEGLDMLGLDMLGLDMLGLDMLGLEGLDMLGLEGLDISQKLALPIAAAFNIRTFSRFKLYHSPGC